MRNWTKEELELASEAMKNAGFMSYEEFCEEIKRQEHLTWESQLELLEVCRKDEEVFTATKNIAANEAGEYDYEEIIRILHAPTFKQTVEEYTYSDTVTREKLMDYIREAM